MATTWKGNRGARLVCQTLNDELYSPYSTDILAFGALQRAL